MSFPLTDNISPLATAQFHEVRQPHWYLILRIALALLTMAYVCFIPTGLSPAHQTSVLIGGLFYIVLQSLLGVVVIINRAKLSLLNAMTALDMLGALCALLCDPSPLPPTLILTAAALTLAAIQYRLRVFVAIFGSSLALLAAMLALRQLLQHKPYDLDFVLVMLFFLAALCPALILCAHAENLCLRTARIAETDPVTGLGNRWTFYEAARYLLPYHLRNLTPMVVMLVDIEIARAVDASNRRYLLKQFASLVNHRLRGCDIAVRYDNTEFAFLLTDTAAKDAEVIAADMQQQFDAWARQKSLAAHARVGLSTIPNRPIALDQILISINAAISRARQREEEVSGTVFAAPEQRR
jgi:diguanylate cyclase (GGDEF)-like protein